jgi:transcriptional regulator with GAF, ATPase, and Fis domain
MATQTVAFPDDLRSAGDLKMVRRSLHASAERLQPRAKLRTYAPPTEHADNEINDSERIVRICAAMNVVLEFIRTAKPRDSGLPIAGGSKHLETRTALESAVEELELLREQLYREKLVLRDEVDRVSMFEEIVGTSPALQATLSRVVKVAATDSTVLITGETGTGKELVARAIHRRSNRASRAFVSVNCAAIPRDLVASELFGHEKGAFTGATQQRLGRFELANGGTIFLDEIGELPAETQIALLRVLQEHEFERVGGTGPIRADIRVIAATNRDFQAAISAGSFRSDLYYRLHVFPIETPALRERKEDIFLLVEYFIDRYARKVGKKITDISEKTLELLRSYHWPGNIRELQNVIERSVILCETEIFSIDESWLPQQPTLTESEGQIGLPLKLVAQEKNMIEAALKESRGRVSGSTGAAARLGIPRSTLESKIRSLKIHKNRFRQVSQSVRPGVTVKP